MDYKILIKKNVIKVLESIPKDNLLRINDSIQKLKTNPRPVGCRIRK